MNRISFFRIILMLILGLSLVVFQSCEEEEIPAIKETGTVTDIDGNVYIAVKIGNQWWMAENLRVKSFRNGAAINDGQVDSVWIQQSAAYCLFGNDSASPGLLYNWYAVNSAEGIAPQGWHIPTDEEWRILEVELGMSDSDARNSGWRGTTEGNELKMPGNSGWTLFKDNWPGNESGFSAAAGGCRLPDGVWGDPGLFAAGFWWSASAKDFQRSYYRYLDYKHPNVYRSADSKSYGFSIRCVKD